MRTYFLNHCVYKKINTNAKCEIHLRIFFDIFIRKEKNRPNNLQQYNSRFGCICKTLRVKICWQAYVLSNHHVLHSQAGGISWAHCKVSAITSPVSPLMCPVLNISCQVRQLVCLPAEPGQVSPATATHGLKLTPTYQTPAHEKDNNRGVLREAAFKREKGQLLGLMTKRRWKKVREKGRERCIKKSWERRLQLLTQGESGRWLASLISCPQSVYGFEQTQDTWCARDSQTASNGNREGWKADIQQEKTNHELSAVLCHLP